MTTAAGTIRYDGKLPTDRLSHVAGVFSRSEGIYKLYVDGRRLIDNDGLHGILAVEGTVKLEGGIHSIRLSYFQGPRTALALMLGVKGPGEKQYRVFNTNDFRPPANPADWKYGSPDDLLLPEKTGKRK